MGKVGSLEQFLSGLRTVELSNDELDKLKEIIETNKRLKEKAIDFICKPERIQEYQLLVVMPDYVEIRKHNGPYDVLCKIGRGNKKAIEYCLQGMQHHGIECRAIAALPKVSTKKYEEGVISELVKFLENKCSEDKHGIDFSVSLVIYVCAAIRALFNMGKKGRNSLRELLFREDTPFTKTIARGIMYESSHYHLDRTMKKRTEILNTEYEIKKAYSLIELTQKSRHENRVVTIAAYISILGRDPFTKLKKRLKEIVKDPESSSDVLDTANYILGLEKEIREEIDDLKNRWIELCYRKRKIIKEKRIIKCQK